MKAIAEHRSGFFLVSVPGFLAIVPALSILILSGVRANQESSNPPPDAISAVLATKADLGLFQPGEPIAFKLHADRPDPGPPDTFDWTLTNYLGETVEGGQLPVAAHTADWNAVLTVHPTSFGYFALQGQFEKSGGEIEPLGSRPAGMATFGVLPNIPLIPLAHRDDARFGIQGEVHAGDPEGDRFEPYYGLLGVDWVNYPAHWALLEPDHAGQFVPRTTPSQWSQTISEARDRLALLVTLDKLPRWAEQLPLFPDWDPLATYPPRNETQWGDFLNRVGAEQYALRRAQFPDQLHGYYQVNWEPDSHWRGTDAQFIQMYAAAYRGLHKGDPGAVVMGPGYGVLSVGDAKLRRLLPLGLGQYLDGITTHAYYHASIDLNHPALSGQLISPEDGGMIDNVRALRQLMRQYLKPGAKLIQSEWGLDNPTSEVTPDLLRRQAAYVTRGHLICLGEGADVTYFFYAADYGGDEKGFGLSFNLSLQTHNYGATSVSPKPTFLACAAMTRLLDGTKTLGPLPDLPHGAHAYSFQRGRQIVTTLWCETGQVPLTFRASDSKVRLFDFMGNPSTLAVKQVQLNLTLTEYPQYVLSDHPLAR